MSPIPDAMVVPNAGCSGMIELRACLLMQLASTRYRKMKHKKINSEHWMQKAKSVL